MAVPAFRLDKRRGALPLYGQLAEQLRHCIEQRELRPGDQLPSETELVAQLGVSRATVGKALDALVAQGLLKREQGRGTFVCERPMERRLPELTGFSDHIRGLGMRPSHKLLSFERHRAHGGDPVLAPFREGTEVVVIHRLRLVDDRVAGLHRSAIAGEVATAVGLDEQSLAAPDASLYAIMAAGGVHLAGAEEALRAVNADEGEAALLGTEPGVALFEVTRISNDENWRLVEVVQARYLGALYVYRIDLARPAPSADAGDRRGHERTAQDDHAGRSAGLVAGGGLRQR